MTTHSNVRGFMNKFSFVAADELVRAVDPNILDHCEVLHIRCVAGRAQASY